jgi:biopolymer transport protein ExbB
VAIPLLLMHSWVASRSRTLVQILDEQSAGLIAQSLEKTDPKNSGKSS